MVNGSYNIIFRKIKEIRGITLDDGPYLCSEIMEAFDNVQKAKLHGLEIAQKLINETSLWLRVIQDQDGKNSYKFVDASNHIASSCLELLMDMLISTCNKATVGHLQPQEGLELLKRVNDMQKLQKRIGELVMTPEVRNTYMNMTKRLSIAQEQLNSLVAIT